MIVGVQIELSAIISMKLDKWYLNILHAFHSLMWCFTSCYFSVL